MAKVQASELGHARMGSIALFHGNETKWREVSRYAADPEALNNA